MSGTTPSSIILVHGAGSGPWVFDRWLEADPNVVAVDLHAGLDIARASTDDYVGQVTGILDGAGPTAALCGWSMGGLIAALAATRSPVASLVLLEPSPPGEVQGFDPNVASTEGRFDPEQVYGAFPTGIRARPESSRARAERKRGISVPGLPARTLVVYGDEFAEERGRAIARHYGCEQKYFPGLSHWDLVLDGRVMRTALDFVHGRFDAENR